MSQQTTKIRIDLSEDKQTVKSRSDRAGVVAKLTPSSALFQAEPTLQQSGAKVIAAGTDLAAADNTVLALEAQLAAARKTRDSKAAAFDSVFALYIANAEHLATTPEEAAGLGLAVAAKGNYPLAPPIDVQAHFDAAKATVRVQVKHAPGIQACVIEMSSDPSSPSEWKRLDGFGARHVLSGVAPGTYWIRAAGARASKHSAFTNPIAVVVK